MSSVIRKIHLYLGLSVGLIFAMSGLTGSFLVFYPQIDDWMTPAVRAAASAARPASYESLYQTLLKARPDRRLHWRIEVPDAGGPIQARSLSAADMVGDGFAPVIVWVDPRDNSVLRDVQWGKFPATWIYDLHYRLLLGKTGSIVMGVVGLLVIGLLATGLWVWWPATLGAARAAFGIRRDGALALQLYDIHKLTGVSGALFLLTIAATGVMISLPQQVQPLLAHLSPPYVPPSTVSVPVAAARRVSVDQALATAVARMPHGQLKWIDTPDGTDGVYAFRFRQPGEPARRFPNSVVWIEQYSGAVLAVREATRDPPAATIVNWQHPLHSGEAFGLPGKIVVALVGLLPAVLFVTGLWRWLLRRRASVSVLAD